MLSIPSRALAAGAAAGAGTWFSRGALDRVTGPAGTFRIAMLPSLPELLLLVIGGAVLSAVFVAALDRVLLRRARLYEPTAPDASDAVMSLFALALLGLPYLLWLPDRLPVLLLLAGPSRYLVWAAVLVFLARATVDLLRRPAHAPPVVPEASARVPWRATLAVLLAGTTVLSAAALRLTATPVFPGGDEPHYLVMAQSLWRDGDLKIENNHARRDYAEYFNRDLPPHYLTRGVDGQIYSIHPVGLPIVLAPIYALVAYRGVSLFLAFAAALAAALTYRYARAITASPEAAAFAWLAIVFSPPFLLNSFAVYPEILAGLCAVIALTTGQVARGPGPWVLHGVAIAALPWLSTKYAPMGAAIGCVLLWRIWRNAPSSMSPSRMIASAAVVVPFGISLALWFFFFYAYWGSPLPSAPYGGYHQTSLIQLRTGLLGLLFDQEYGVVPYSPIVIVGFTGLVSMWRAGGETRRPAIELSVAILALMSTVGAFRIWWGGSAAPGRPMASGLLLFAVPIAWQYARAVESPVRRTAYWLLAIAGIGFSAVMVVAQQGLLIANDRDGSSRLLEWLSPSWRVWALAPSFIFHYPWTAGAFILVWLAVAWLALWLLQRYSGTPKDRPAAGRAGLAVLVTCTAAIAIVALTIQTLLGSVMQPDVRLAGRARLALLDSYDASRRPIALVYDPLRRVAPAEVPGLTELLATAGVRRPRQAIALLYNARFSLPAGEYEVELRRAPNAGTPSPQPALSLQIGRIGQPLRMWQVSFGPDGVWRERFTLPIDVGFVGFRGSDGIEQIAPELRLHPVRVTDARARPRTGEVLGASSYGRDTVYFHEEKIWAERAGFWTRGQATVPVTIATAPGRSVTLRLRGGPIPNTVTLETPAWREQFRVEPGVPREVTIAAGPDGVIALRVTNASGFVPSRLDGKSKDNRLLGSWIELPQP